MGMPPGTGVAAPSFWSKYWKPVVVVGCLGVLFFLFLFVLAIAGWFFYRQSGPAEVAVEAAPTAGGGEDDAQGRIEERVAVLDQPPPAFLRAKGEGRPPDGPLPDVPAAVKPAVLAVVDAQSADVETRFMRALLKGDVDGALALTGEQLRASGGAASMRLFAALAADHGGGSFVAEKAAQLPDGAKATTGRVTYQDGTSVKVTVLSVDGKVDGFTAGP